MRLNCEILLLTACAIGITSWLTSEALAQTSDRPIGPFAFVNAIDSDKPTFVYIDGDPYKPRGYSSGQMTYGGQTYAGNKILRVENEEFGSDSVSINITPNSAPVVIAYIKQTEAENGKIKKELKILTLPSAASSVAKYSGLYVGSHKAANLSLNNTQFSLEPMKLTSLVETKAIQFKLQNGAEDPITYSPEVPGHFILVIYDTRDGNQNVSIFEDVSG